jgi:hypothetical protein
MAGPPPPPPAGPPKAAGPPPPPGGLPPPPKAPPKFPDFVFTDEDIEKGALALVAGLPEPKKLEVAPDGQRHAIGLAGPKGGKTIASIAVKTDSCIGLPRPEGSIVVVMHVDNQAPNSFDNFLFANKIKLDESEKPFFIGIGDPKGDYKARVRRSDPACSVYVKEVIMSAMRKLAERGDVGLFVFDGYGDFTTMYGGYVAAHANGFDSQLKLEGTMWHPRREMFSDLTSAARAAVVPGGWAVLNGPDGGFETEREKEPGKLLKRLKKEGWTDREPPAKWLSYRENSMNLSAIIATRVGLQGGKPSYVASVVEARLSRHGFNTGDEEDYTGKNLGVFCESLASTQ